MVRFTQGFIYIAWVMGTLMFNVGSGSSTPGEKPRRRREMKQERETGERERVGKCKKESRMDPRTIERLNSTDSR